MIDGFGKFLVCPVLFFLSLVVFSGCSEKNTKEKFLEVDLSLSPFDALLEENSWLLHPDEDILLLNVNGEIRAFDSRCPYQQCTSDWHYSPGIWTCGCCDSRFDSFGQYLSGPATDNMIELSVSRDENVLFIG